MIIFVIVVFLQYFFCVMVDFTFRFRIKECLYFIVLGYRYRSVYEDGIVCQIEVIGQGKLEEGLYGFGMIYCFQGLGKVVDLLF